MNLNPDIHEMFNDIAVSLNLDCKKIIDRGCEMYTFIHDNNPLIRFTPLMDMKGRMNLLCSYGDLTKKPTSLGLFEKEHLLTTAKPKIIITITEAIKNKNIIYKGQELFEN